MTSPKKMRADPFGVDPAKLESISDFGSENNTAKFLLFRQPSNLHFALFK
jgi:hypothetical protein